MHQNITESVNDSALWFDEFFMLDQNSLSDQALGEARIQLGWSPRSRDLNEFENRLKLRYKLPNLKNRVDLVFSDYDDEIADNPLQNTKIDNRSERNRFSLALQWKAKPDSGLSHRIGIGRRLQPFVKSRFRSLLNINHQADIRFETSAYYYSNDGFGADFSLLYSYVFTPQSMFRFNNHFYYRDSTNDWLWQHSWQHLNQINDKNALITGFYMEGLSQPTYHLQEYLTSSRWRINALRDWLFFEVEPFVMWRKDEAFSASYGVSLRIEGYFGQT
ncbi:hypothetical protein AX660_07690 [Paraglaciecola hydrolytica]|uniref:Uncharacterized protein n=2 Tax=Paraglaciecola hydrolytica TaxID=1799789 RepID=A0A136A3S5_9ALTE|nr:hypothetical protein AX660_07690 [Paraglaciecola hydrolytica]